ncbi:MAG: thiamine pyrophosphate-dependent dehydrogenase E1 component subunit alpha [Fimbriiglobus sp.]
MIEPPEGISGPLRRRESTAVAKSGRETISIEVALTIYRYMVQARALEERSIKMSKSGEAYFWIGGPGEEAFNSCLGMQVRRGSGIEFDYLHLHYRNSATLIAMGMPMLDHFRQLAMAVTDPFSRGRNFVGHYARADWNVIPVTSVIEVQYLMAPGTALMQKRSGSDGITIVTGGDAGTAEGDFESCLLWSSRPGNELPVLMIVTNNQFGISTPLNTQINVKRISDRALPYRIEHETVDGNDPVASWNAIDRAMRYCREQKKPFLLEANVSRLHGHSSSSGAQRNWSETDCLALFEQKLIDLGALSADQAQAMREDAKAEADAAVVQATSEAKPQGADVESGTYAPSTVDVVYPEDYTGLPQAR